MHMLKRLGGWRSDSVAEGYVDDSIANKVRTSKKIFQTAIEETVTLIPQQAATSDENVKHNVKPSISNAILPATVTSAAFVDVEQEAVSISNSNSILPTNNTSKKLQHESATITSSTFHNCIFNFNYNNNK